MSTVGMDDLLNPMRLAKKAWNHVGMFTRQEAIEWLSEKLVSQKRRVLMRDCVRIIYYCHVQRSCGCRYEISVCVPSDPNEKLRIDDFNTHTCNLDESRLKRRAKPQLEDFDKPIEKRKYTSNQRSTLPTKDDDVVYSLEESMATFLNGYNEHNNYGDGDIDVIGEDQYPPPDSQMNVLPHQNDDLKRMSRISTPTLMTSPAMPLAIGAVWSLVDINIVDFSKTPDGCFTHLFHAKDEVSQYSYGFPLVNSQPEVVGEALVNLFYQFGPPDAIKINGIYSGTYLETLVRNKFPDIELRFLHQRKNGNGGLLPRRSEIIIKERFNIYLMENHKQSWMKHINEITFAHNSEWIDEIDGTALEKFFDRSRHMEACRNRKCDHMIDDRMLHDNTSNVSNQSNIPPFMKYEEN